MNSKTGTWLVFIAALLWAIDAPFRKFLTGDLSSTAIVLMEHILIGILVLPLFLPRLKELQALSVKEWLALIFIALGGSALATVLFTESFRYVNPTVSILLQKIQPFIAILLAVVVLKEALTKRFWLWALVGMFGAYLLTFPELSISGLSFNGATLGVVFALSAAFFWGGSTVFGRFILRKISFQMMTSLRFLGALVFLLLLQIFRGNGLGEITRASSQDWLYILIIAVLAGYVSLFLYYRGLRSTKASIATIAELAFPLSAVIINWIFLDATLSAGQIVGSIILVIAISNLSLTKTENLETKKPGGLA